MPFLKTDVLGIVVKNTDYIHALSKKHILNHTINQIQNQEKIFIFHLEFTFFSHLRY